MTEDERKQAAAWDKDLGVMRTIIGAQLGPGADEATVHQTALGTLLVSTLPDGALERAAKLIQDEVHRRADQRDPPVRALPTQPPDVPVTVDEELIRLATDLGRITTDLQLQMEQGVSSAKVLGELLHRVRELFWVPEADRVTSFGDARGFAQFGPVDPPGSMSRVDLLDIFFRDRQAAEEFVRDVPVPQFILQLKSDISDEDVQAFIETFRDATNPAWRAQILPMPSKQLISRRHPSAIDSDQLTLVDMVLLERLEELHVDVDVFVMQLEGHGGSEGPTVAELRQKIDAVTEIQCQWNPDHSDLYGDPPDMICDSCAADDGPPIPEGS